MAAVESMTEVAAKVPQITSNMTVKSRESEDLVKGKVRDTPSEIPPLESAGDENPYPEPDPNMFKKNRNPKRKTVTIDDSDLCSKECMGYKLGTLYSKFNGDENNIRTKCKDCPDTCMGHKVGKFAAELDAPEGSAGAPLDTPCAGGTFADLFDTLRCLFSALIFQEKEQENKELRKEELLAKRSASTAPDAAEEPHTEHRAIDADKDFTPCFCKRRRVVSSPDGLIQFKMNDDYCLKVCDCVDDEPEPEEEVKKEPTKCDKFKEQFFKTNKDFQKWRRQRNAQTDIMREKMGKVYKRESAVAKKKMRKKFKETSKKAKKSFKKASKKAKAKVKKRAKDTKKRIRNKAANIRGDKAPKEGDGLSLRDLKDIICSSTSSLTAKAKKHNEEFKARREAQAEEYQRKMETLRELAPKQVKNPCACKQMEKLLQEYDLRKSGLVDPNTDQTETPDTDQTETPDTDQTETLDTDQAETPDTDQAETPDTEQAETPDTEQAETPDTEQAETPDTDQAETPDTDQVNEERPDTEQTEPIECDDEMGTCDPRLIRLAQKAGQPTAVDKPDCVCESVVDILARHGIKNPKLVMCKRKKQPGMLSKICIKFEEIKSVFIKDDCTKTGCFDDKRPLEQ
ncbi:neurofilament heavy polypeptide [Plutella xylostella]|uniref:neurofilament heavy polypeptide n=1 Tax=Plutella xylostella TaxID=51655 RepID=UPI0020331AA2|nr:neurofilament heavy polypeptide [Plutella xylostella]